MKSAGGKKSRSVYTEHRDSVERFQRASKEIEEIKDEIGRLRAGGHPCWEQAIEAKDRVLELEERLRRMQEDNDEVEYYRNVGDILLKYFETYETSDEAALAPDEPAKPAKNSIINFFMRKDGAAAAKPQAAAESRGSMFERYMEAVDKSYMRRGGTEPDDDEVCPHCRQRTRQILNKDGIAHCSNCHTVERVLVEVDKPSYKEPPTDVVYYAYRRINHYNECLNQIQAKEYTEIPNEVIDSILVELKKQKITNMATLTPMKVRGILRKLGIHKYYEHTPFIIYKLNGLPPPRFGEELEEKLRQMFYAVQVPYLRHASHKRKNFLSYNYVFHKFLLILGRPEFTKYFPLLKSREKLHEQEQVFQKICADLGWPFIKSI